MEESAEFEGGTQEERRLDLRALFQGAIRVVIENVLQEEVRELVGARRFERLGQRKDVLSLTAGDCMTATPKTILPDEFAMTALNIMEQKKITSLVVVGKSGDVEGVIHLHDLWGTQMV